MDKNLRLVVLDALRSARLVAKPKRVARDGYDERVEAERLALLDDALWEKAAAKLSELTFDGGLSIFHEIHAGWDGEADTFDVHDLAGIERLRALRKVTLLALYPADLRPLAKLPALMEIVAGRVDDLRPLEKCKALKSIRCEPADSEANRAVVERWKARGIAVDAPFEGGAEAGAERDAEAAEARAEAERDRKKLDAKIAKKPTFFALLERAQVQLSLGAYEQAIADVDAAAAIAKPKEKAEHLGSALDLRGRASFHLGRFRDAVADYTRALEADWPSLDNRAEAWLRAGDLDAAMKDVEASIAEEGRATDFILFVRGSIHLAKGRKKEALADWRKATDSEEAKRALAANGG